MEKVSVQTLAAFLVFTTILAQVWHISAQDKSGLEYFGLMVESIGQYASRLAEIYDSGCDPNACTCSQDMCQPLPKGSNSTCIGSQSSTNLYNCSGFFQEKLGQGATAVCASIKVTRTKSVVTYVRSAVDTPASPAQQSAVCRTQQLDGVFESRSNLIEWYTENYVGLVDGSFRSFPGREEGGEECLAFDSRKRPWYNGAISHPNHLVILIDCGHTMSGDAQPGRLESRLEVASKFALALMETVYKDNYVNVFSFGASSNDTFGESTQVGFDPENPDIHPELDNLKLKISSLRNLSSEIDTSPSDFAAGLTLALRAFNETPIDGLLEVIVFTDGSFTDGGVESSVLDQVKRSNIHLFIYGINSGASTTGLENLKTQVNAFYRDLSGQDFTDPLLSVQSYFAYLAVSHKNLYNDTAFWSPNYRDYYSVGDIVTVTKPVFTANNAFVGVVAIDVILNELGAKAGVAFTDAVNFQRNNQDATARGATNQNMTSARQLFDDSSCQYNAVETLLCKARSVPDDYDPREGKCCDRCGKGSGDDNKTTIGIIVGPVFAATAAIAIAVFVWRRKREPKAEETAMGAEFRPNREPEGSNNGRWERPL